MARTQYVAETCRHTALTRLQQRRAAANGAQDLQAASELAQQLEAAGLPGWRLAPLGQLQPPSQGDLPLDRWATLPLLDPAAALMHAVPSCALDCFPSGIHAPMQLGLLVPIDPEVVG